MVKLRRIFQDYEESGAMNALVPVHAALDDHTFLAKNGDLITVLAFRGPDDECLDESERDRITRGFESTVRMFDEDFRLYQYWMKRDHVAIPSRTYMNPVVQEATAGRVAYLLNRPLCAVDTYFAVVYEGWRHDKNWHEQIRDILRDPLCRLRQMFSLHEKVRTLGKELTAAHEILTRKVQSFVVQLPEELHARILDKQEAFRFLRRLLNYESYKSDAVRLKYDEFVDFQAVDSVLECHRDHLRLDDVHVQVLTLKDPPAQTFAHVLRGLQGVPGNVIVATEWKRENHSSIRHEIRSKRRHFHNAKSSLANYLTAAGETAPRDTLVDDGAVAVVSALGDCLREIDIHGRSFGRFSLTVILYGKDLAAVRRSAAESFKVFATADAQLIEERYNLLNAWLAVLPGNRAYNVRHFWLLDSNYADLSLLFTPHPGEIENTHLGTEYLAVLETQQGAPYFFNLHYQDIAHTLLLGATGSGKSFLLNFLLTHLQKYDPLTCIFDLGGSYEQLTRLMHGAYLPVRWENRSVSINPFILPPTPGNLHFLLAFLKVLIETGSFRMNTEEERDLYEQIENLYVVGPGERRLLTLSHMLNRKLRIQLQKWVEGGPFAGFFDHAEDNLTLCRFQTFDFAGMDHIPQVLEPLLFYILHRANTAIDEEPPTTFKAFVIDEAWRFFHHSATRLYILEALKTWRKRNAAMILATQSSDDLLRSQILPVVVESCATKLFLANPDMDPEQYREVFHLNTTEADRIARLTPKQQILVKRPDRSKVVELHVSPKDYWLYTSNPYDGERRRQAFEQYGFKEGLDRLTRSNL